MGLMDFLRGNQNGYVLMQAGKAISGDEIETLAEITTNMALGIIESRRIGIPTGPLVVMAEYLAKDPRYVVLSVAANWVAAGHSFQNSKERRAALNGILAKADELPSVSDSFLARWETVYYAHYGSGQSDVALNGILDNSKKLPRASERFDASWVFAHYSRIRDPRKNQAVLCMENNAGKMEKEKDSDWAQAIAGAYAQRNFGNPQRTAEEIETFTAVDWAQKIARSYAEDKPFGVPPRKAEKNASFAAILEEAKSEITPKKSIISIRMDRDEARIFEQKYGLV